MVYKIKIDNFKIDVLLIYLIRGKYRQSVVLKNLNHRVTLEI